MNGRYRLGHGAEGARERPPDRGSCGPSRRMARPGSFTGPPYLCTGANPPRASLGHLKAAANPPHELLDWEVMPQVQFCGALLEKT